MITKMEYFPAKNPNPMLSVAKDMTVLYSNDAGEPLLREWGIRVGDKLPPNIADFVQRAIFRNSPEKMEVKEGENVYLVIFHPSPEEECVNVYGFDISDQKELEEKLRIKEKQNDVLYKIGKIALEYESLQTFMDESLKLIANILDLEYCKIMELMPDGRFLLRAGIGWKSEFVGKNVVGGEQKSQSGYTILSGIPVIVEDFEDENRFKKPEILKIHGVASGASVVIGSKEKIFGILCVHSTKKRKFTSDDTYFLTSVAFLIAQVAERKKAEEALKKAYDSLEEKVKERTSQLEKAYESLKESEKGLAEAQKMAHMGNWEWNFVTNELYYSDELYRIFGLNPQELNVPFDEVLAYIHPEDRDYVTNSIIEALNGKKYDAIDFRIILADGTERTVFTQGEVTFDEKNTPIRLRGTVQDITERRQMNEALRESEEKYRNIVETANEGILMIDDKATITYANKKLMDTLGYRLEEGIGKSIWGFISEELKYVVKINLEKRRQGICESYELKLICKDSSALWVFVNSKPLFDKKGMYIGSMSMLTDITKRKEAEETLANIETARKKEIHHRIKNNLQVITSLLDLQADKFKNREDIKDSEVFEAFRESRDRVISMALIHEKLHKGGGLDTLNFSSYIEELAENLFLTCRLGDTNVTLNMDLEEDIFLDMDTAVPLGIIVNELVSNSFKHAFPGRDKGEIQIKLLREGNGECLKYRMDVNGIRENKNEGCEDTSFVLIVSDNGMGIPEYQEIECLDSLGLQLVNSLIEQLDGKLQMKRNGGTEFTIRFAVAKKSRKYQPPTTTVN
jgi:PAS domain S-box-containing protein